MEGVKFSERVRAAADAVRAADTVLQQVLDSEFPEGTEVYVVHSRGCYDGKVVRCFTYAGPEIVVENSITGNRKKWHYQNVQKKEAR